MLPPENNSSSGTYCKLLTVRAAAAVVVPIEVKQRRADVKWLKNELESFLTGLNYFFNSPHADRSRLVNLPTLVLSHYLKVNLNKTLKILRISFAGSTSSLCGKLNWFTTTSMVYHG